MTIVFSELTSGENFRLSSSLNASANKTNRKLLRSSSLSTDAKLFYLLPGSDMVILTETSSICWTLAFLYLLSWIQLARNALKHWDYAHPLVHTQLLSSARIRIYLYLHQCVKMHMNRLHVVAYTASEKLCQCIHNSIDLIYIQSLRALCQRDSEYCRGLSLLPPW